MCEVRKIRTVVLIDTTLNNRGRENLATITKLLIFQFGLRPQCPEITRFYGFPGVPRHFLTLQIYRSVGKNEKHDKKRVFEEKDFYKNRSYFDLYRTVFDDFLRRLKAPRSPLSNGAKIVKNGSVEIVKRSILVQIFPFKISFF